MRVRWAVGKARSWLMGACASIAIACAAPGVERGPTTMPTLRPIGSASIVLGELGRPRSTVAIGPTQQMGMQTLEAGVRRLDHAERELLGLYDRADVADRVIASADLGPAGAPDPAFLVAYRVLSYDEHFDGPDGRYWLGFIIGDITAGLGWLLAIESHANSSHTFQFEVRVFDVRGAPMVRAQLSDGTIQNVYDTSIAAPLLRRSYDGTMHTWIASGTGGPGGVELDRFMDEQGGEIARVMFELSAADVVQALARGLASPPPSVGSRAALSATPVQDITSGGETPLP